MNASPLAMVDIMKYIKNIKIALICLVFFSNFCLSQNTPGTPKDTLKKEVIIEGKRFKIFNNYLMGGAGVGYNSKIPPLQFAGGVDYNFHIKVKYFQAGVFVSGDEFRNYNNTQFHFAFGKRKENSQYHFGYFGGLSYAQYYNRVGQKYSHTMKRNVGLYGCLQLVKKITYDVGIGTSIFADVNSKQSFIGIRADLYFSGAYKGKKGE